MMKNNLFAGIIIALGLAVCGLFIYLGISKFVAKDQVVNVKGLATRDVQADYVVWPLSFSIAANDVNTLYSQLGATQKIVHDFLLEKGFSEDEISNGSVSVNDNWASYYGNRPEYQYTLSSKVIVSTANVELVRKSNGSQTELLQKGIILDSSEWSVSYDFRGLTDLKPEMIEEATKNARAVAQKFADDSKCSLGNIATANQGQFSIEDDAYQPWIKHIRVVTTVSFYLK